MGFLHGKRALITGLISNKSMSYGIAHAMQQQGATLAFSYQNERVKERVEKLANDFKHAPCFPCDVSNDDEIDQMFEQLKKHWHRFDILVHSIAYAPGDQLQGHYLDNLNRQGFQIAHDISSYSFAALMKAGRTMMNHGGAAITLTYIGANRVVPNYNLMGVAKASLEANVRYMAHDLGRNKIRVNAVSAGPVKTLAASGIKDFRKMLKANAEIVPLGENTTIEQVGNVTAFLASNLADGITGEVIHVDGGFHAVAMAAAD